jgi:hypothetical protein
MYGILAEWIGVLHRKYLLSRPNTSFFAPGRAYPRALSTPLHRFIFHGTLRFICRAGRVSGISDRCMADRNGPLVPGADEESESRLSIMTLEGDDEQCPEL